MIKEPKRSASKLNPPSHDEIKNNIKLQTEAFLNLGGIIQCIPNGVSGQVWKPQTYTKSHK
jgi:hypothetical protein